MQESESVFRGVVFLIPFANEARLESISDEIRHTWNKSGSASELRRCQSAVEGMALLGGFQGPLGAAFSASGFLVVVPARSTPLLMMRGSNRSRFSNFNGGVS